jgi:hypothetical protein
MKTIRLSALPAPILDAIDKGEGSYPSGSGIIHVIKDRDNVILRYEDMWGIIHDPHLVTRPGNEIVVRTAND